MSANLNDYQGRWYEVKFFILQGIVCTLLCVAVSNCVRRFITAFTT